MCKHVHAHIICHISVDTCFLDGSRLRGLRHDPPMPCRWSPVDSSHGHYTNHQVSHHTQDDMHYITIVVIYWIYDPALNWRTLLRQEQKKKQGIKSHPSAHPSNQTIKQPLPDFNTAVNKQMVNCGKFHPSASNNMMIIMKQIKWLSIPIIHKTYYHYFTWQKK